MLVFSPTISAISKSLSELQGELKNATKNSINPHFKNRYADLQEVLDTIKPLVSKYALSFTQHPSYCDGVVSVTTLLAHESGEFLQSTCSCPCPKLDPQGVGSAITYLRRYSVQAIFGFASEDDDANSVSNISPTSIPKGVAILPPKPATPSITIK